MTTNKPEVKRWEPENTIVGYNMRPCDDGSFVLVCDYETLQAECEKLRKDAERLDWMERDMLSDEGQQIEAVDGMLRKPYLVSGAGGLGGGVGETVSKTLREAIDAAMQADNPC